jgi:hypothetical protein
MSSLPEILNSETKKNQVVDDCCTVIDQEVADKGGLSGIAIKAGFAAVKGVKPGFVRHVVFDLLPEFAAALDPIFQEAKRKSVPVGPHFISNAGRVADALLANYRGARTWATPNLRAGIVACAKALAARAERSGSRLSW